MELRVPGSRGRVEELTGHLTKGIPMGLGDKISNAAQDAKGKVQEGVGKAIDNEQMEAEGKADQVAADAKQAVENVKDAARDATR